jgi:uncharacterized protein with PIN domain
MTREDEKLIKEFKQIIFTKDQMAIERKYGMPALSFYIGLLTERNRVRELIESMESGEHLQDDLLYNMEVEE